MAENIVGTATIVINPATVGFEERLHAQTAPAFGRVGKDAEKAGEEGGQRLSKGFSTGTSGIGRILNNLGVPFSNFGGHLTGTADKMAKVDAQASHLGATMATLGSKTLLGVGVAMTGVAAAGVDLAIKQEKVTTSIANSERISVKAAEGISNAFLSTAGSAIYSGRAIGEAFQPVAGVLGAIQGHALGAGESLKFMRTAMDLAEASGNQLGSTTETLAKVMQAYKIGVDGAGHASDVLWNASRQTGIGIDQLATVLGRVRGKLGDLSPSLGESAGLINTLAKNGAQGRVAVAALSTSLTTLTSNSKTTNDMAQQLGVHIFDSKGKFEGLRSVLEQLQKPMSELEPKYQMIATKALFGGAANKQLLSVIMQGPSAFDTATKAVERHGTAQTAAERQGKTLENRMKTLRATAEDLATRVGQLLVPMLTKLVGGLKEGVEWLQKHETAAKALATVIATILGAAIGSFVAVKVAGFIGGTKQMVAALAQLGTKMLATAGVMQGADAAMVAGADTAAAGVDAALMGTGIGATLVLLGVAAYELSEHWEEAMKGLEEGAVAAANVVIGIINSLIESVNKLVSTLTLGLVPAIGKLGELSVEEESSGGILPDERAARKGEHFTRKEEEENEAEGTLAEKGKGGLSARSGGLMAFFMKNLHLTAAQAAGIAGNVMQESSFNPNAPGGGLFQYIGSRAGSGKGSFYQQLEATQRELQGPYRGVLAQLHKAKTPEEAARIWERGFEKPEKGSEAKREQYAREAFKQHPQHEKALEKNTAAIEHHTKTLTGTGTLATKTKAKAESEYIDPFLHASGLKRGREDMGIDFSASPGSKIGAIGAGIIDKIIPNWFKGQPLIEEKLTSGSHKGEFVYYAEQINKMVKEGQHVKAGQTIGTVAAHGTGLELGFGAGGGRTLAQATTGYTEGQKTPAAESFSKFLASVGKGGTALQVASKTFEVAAKAELKKQADDKRAGESVLQKTTQAIQSGGVKELSKVVGGAHETALAKLEARLHGDHTTALDKLVSKLKEVHEKAMAALSKALVKAEEKAFYEKAKHDADVRTTEADAAALNIANAAKVRTDQIAEGGLTGGALSVAQSQTALDAITEHFDELIGHWKVEVAKAAGHGEGAETYATVELTNAENQAKIAEAQARSTLEITTAEDRNKTERERLKVEEERLAQERKGTAANAGPPANFNITIPNGTQVSAAELLQEIAFHIHAGTLPVAVAQ